MLNRVAATRRGRGWTQFELARRANVSPSIISQLETGKLFPYPGWRRRLAQALEVSEGDLFPEPVAAQESSHD